MPRKHARMLLSMWDNEDWLALTTAQQQTYWTILGHEDLTYCGVAPLLPSRWVTASDLNVRKVQANVATLEAGRFLVIDRDTSEICVRTFVRHDGLMGQPNVVKAMVKALGKVHSRTIHATIVDELRRFRAEEPELKGWETIGQINPALLDDVSAEPLPIPFGNPKRRAS